MKVLHVIPSVSLVRGGTSQAVLDIVKVLLDRCIDAEILTTNDNGPDLLDVPVCQCTAYKQVPIWFFPRFSPPIKPLKEFAFSHLLTTWLWQNITKYDLVHIHALFSYVCTTTMAIAHIKKIPYLVRPHGLLCTWSLQQSAWKKQIYLALIERANLNHSQALEFTTLQEQREAAPLALKPPSFILPFSVSVPTPIPDARQLLRQRLQIPADEPIILFMSRLHYKKGLDYLIAALGAIKNQRFTFVLAGSGSPDYESQIEAQLLAVGIGDRTHRVGFVQGEIKELLLQGSDIFALTSHSESFGLAVLEAIAAGLAIVITPGVPLAPVVEQYQLGCITALETATIARSLQKCLEDLNNCQQTKQRHDRARQLILKQYSWGSIASNLSEVYKSILDKEPLPNFD